MAQYWTRKRDQDDLDEKTANPFAEAVSHGNMFLPDPKGGKDEGGEEMDELMERSLPGGV